MLVTPSGTTPARRGVILMVVLLLLTLFTILGLTFVLLADSYATSARVARQAEDHPRPDIDAELALSFVLGQLIYDIPDDPVGDHFTLRGAQSRPEYVRLDDTAQALNDKAYAGLGRLHYPSAPFPALNDSDLLNYQFFAGDGWVRDPERLGNRIPGQPRGSYVPGNVSYTYVDNNNAFLAFLNSSTNTIDVPSFHRPWVFNLDPQYRGSLLAKPLPFNDPRHPNWTSPAGKYLTLRPRAAEMGPGFPYPQDAGGDVKNYDGGPGGCDSIWIDVNAPVMLSADGRKYKMLVAPLLIELDSRLNLNVHGNIGARNNGHAGNQGWGAWEVNLGKDDRRPERAPDRRSGMGQLIPRLTRGRPSPRSVRPRRSAVASRWHATRSCGQPGRGNRCAACRVTRRERCASIPVCCLDSFPTPVHFASRRLHTVCPSAFGPGFPMFPLSGYNDGFPREYDEFRYRRSTVCIHPLLYDPLFPAAGNRAFSIGDMVKLLRYGGTNYEFLGSDLIRLCPNNFNNSAIRNLVTTTSFDLDRPAPLPYAWDKDAAPYKLQRLYPYALTQPDVTAPFGANQFTDSRSKHGKGRCPRIPSSI